MLRCASRRSGRVLDAERSLFSAELGYAQTQADLFNAIVSVYKAMGGGWVDAPG